MRRSVEEKFYTLMWCLTGNISVKTSPSSDTNLDSHRNAYPNLRKSTDPTCNGLKMDLPIQRFMLLSAFGGR
jgi:hypothetical protein